MLLSQTSEYALRAMSFIALKEGEAQALRAKDIGAAIAIPTHYLSKVLRRLVAAELLKAVKGHNGGFALARAAKKIKIVDVLGAVETNVPAKHCIFGWRACSSKEPCILHHRWSSVNEAFQNWARTTTLADIKDDAKREGWLTNFSDPYRPRDA